MVATYNFGSVYESHHESRTIVIYVPSAQLSSGAA